jgi:AcrR family transcriptional regulator
MTNLVEKTMENTEKQDKVREEIVIEASKLFQKYGYLKTSMEDIAKAAKKGKSSLYYYYKSKDDVFSDVIIKEAEEVYKAGETAVSKESTASEKLKAYFDTTFVVIKNKVNMYSIVKGELCDRVGIVSSLKKQIDSKYVQIVKDIIALGIKNKEFLYMSDREIAVSAVVFSASLRGVFLNLIQNEESDNFEEALKVLVNIFLRGIKR